MRRLRIPVDEYTTPSPQTVERRTPLGVGATLMRSHGFRHVPVVDGDRPVGIISDRDVRLLAGVQGSESVSAGDVMVSNPYCVEASAPLEEVVLAMSRQKIGSVIVTEAGRLVGIFTSTDALNALVEIVRGEAP